MLKCVVGEYFFIGAGEEIRGLVRSRGLGDVYERLGLHLLGLHLLGLHLLGLHLLGLHLLGLHLLGLHLSLLHI